MTKSIFLVFAFFALASIASAGWFTEMNHEYSGASSAKIAEGLKDTLLKNIGRISNVDERNKFKADLNAASDSDRKMKQISTNTVKEIFEIIKVKNPNCDADSNGVVKGDELKCLNYAWKGFVPQ